jgi:heterodisulfide reductase subunit C
VYVVTDSDLEEIQMVKPDPEFTKEVLERSGPTLNLCFQCGTCTGSCASGKFTAFRTRKVVRQAQLGIKEVLASDDLWACTTCYTCFERCPRQVDIPDIILTLRNLAVKEGYMAEAHKKNASTLARIGHMIPLGDKFKEAREKMGLDAQPNTTLINEDDMEQVKKILTATGFMELLGGD